MITLLKWKLQPLGLTAGNWCTNSCLIATSKSDINHSEERLSPLCSNASLRSEKASEKACFVGQKEDSNWYKYWGCHLSRGHKHLAREQWSYLNLFSPSQNFQEIVCSEQQDSLPIGKDCITLDNIFPWDHCTPGQVMKCLRMSEIWISNHLRVRQNIWSFQSNFTLFRDWLSMSISNWMLQWRITEMMHRLCYWKFLEIFSKYSNLLNLI